MRSDEYEAMTPLEPDQPCFEAHFTAESGSIPGWKRVLDLGCILAALPLVVPLSLLIALALKILSPGPVVFKQTRIGYLGRRFEILKFRTMKLNADTAAHQTHLNELVSSGRPMTKLDVADPRLIPFGSWLRTSAIDELPQSRHR